MNRCLYCYKELTDSSIGYHKKCIKKFFGSNIVPELPYPEDKFEELALLVIKSHSNVTGVQKKLSLDIEKINKSIYKFTIVGLWGNYILKPQSNEYSYLPEIEDLTMHLAEISKLKTVPHSLVRMKSGNLAYITKRIDRLNNEKLPMEDMCQLSEKLTEEKYNGSYEQIAKLIKKYSNTSGIDIVNFAESILFSFITGNADMHLKNYSIVKDPKIGYCLSPFYDLLCTKIIIKEDEEELALNLNGKKKKINKNDFYLAFKNFGLNEKQIDNIFNKYQNLIERFINFVERAFVPKNLKDDYKNLILNRSEIFFS